MAPYVDGGSPYGRTDSAGTCKRRGGAVAPRGLFRSRSPLRTLGGRLVFTLTATATATASPQSLGYKATSRFVVSL